MCNWKFATINVLSASDDFYLAECLRQCTLANLDICCFQEFRRLGKDTVSLPITIDDTKTVWDVYWSGYKKKRAAGVAIAIRKSKYIKIKDIGQVSPRLIWIDCVFNGINMQIVSAYAPTEVSKESAKDQFYKILRDNCKVAPKQQLILGADMNSTADYGKSFMGGKKCFMGESNDNGKRFYNFLNTKEYALLNTWFEHKKLHRDTWYSNTGSVSKTIDYIAQTRWLSQYCVDCRVRTSYSFNNTDHRLLICRMRTPRRKCDFNRFVKKKSKAKFDINCLKDEYIRTNFVTKVNDLCIMIDDPNVKVTDCKKLISILESAAEQCLPNVVKTAEAYMWDNDTVLNDLNMKRDKLDRNQHKQAYKDLSKHIRKRFDELRTLYYQNMANQISEANEARNIEKMFRLSKQKMSSKKPSDIICEGLEEHFINHFNHCPPSTEPPSEITTIPEFIKRLQSIGLADSNECTEHYTHPPSSAEIINVIKKFKNKKASSDIPAEYLKAITDCPNYINLLTNMYRDVWDNIVIADEWRKTTITPLYKNKGSRKDPTNYRGLSIGSVYLKLAMSIILERIKIWYNKQLLVNQNGFRQYFGCPDAIYTIKSLHHASVRSCTETFLLFVDLTAAYDWCVRSWLFQSIYNRINESNTSARTCFRIMEELYLKTEAALKSDDPKYFVTTSGVRQGGSESPNLFNLFLDYIMRIYNEKVKELGIIVKYHYRIKDQVRKRGEQYSGQGDFPWVGYADDLTLVADSQLNLQKAANIFTDLLGAYGLVLSIDKTQSMILNYQSDEYPDTIIKINNQVIKNVKSFKYLGASLTYNEAGTSKLEIANRIAMANAKFSSLKKLVCNYHLKLSIRVRFYEVYIRSRLCYCCETWTLTKSQLQQIESAHINFLRRMVRGGMDRRSSKKEIKEAKDLAKHGEVDDLNNIDWAWKFNNNKIMQLTKTPTMSSYIEKQNTKWVAHVCRASNETLTKQLMFIDEKCTKKGNRPKTVYENIIKIQNDKYGLSPEAFLKSTCKR